MSYYTDTEADVLVADARTHLALRPDADLELMLDSLATASRDPRGDVASDRDHLLLGIAERIGF